MSSEITTYITPTSTDRQVFAVYDDNTIRVYQAYCDDIADAALQNGRFVVPSFNMRRMTWIKPSFLWMMYRSGWGLKDSKQTRILAIDITREGFEWALANSCLSHPTDRFLVKSDWATLKDLYPVRIQWDPGRDLQLRPIAQRAIQIGLKGRAIELFVNKWISRITDISEASKAIHALVSEQRLDEALALLPEERRYPLSSKLAAQLCAHY